MSKLILRVSLIGLIVFPLLCIGLMVLYIILQKGCNHCGVELMLTLVPLSIAALVAIMAVASQEKKRAARIALTLNILAIIFFISIDRFNVMVQYDRWLERGMPARFEKFR